MHPSDVWVHRGVLSAVVGMAVVAGVVRSPFAGFLIFVAGIVPTLLLTTADRHFYGTRRRR